MTILRKILTRTQLARWLDTRAIRLAGLSALLRQTENFAHARWLGRPVWQNLADIWTIQELIVDREVDFVIECGTNRGGSAFFMATVFDLLDRGRIVTIDLQRLIGFTHPRIEFLQGSSTDATILDAVRSRVDAVRPAEVLVVLDSDHSADHVLDELRLYSKFVPLGGYVVVQDGVLDELPGYRSLRPGPLVGIRRFLAENGCFEIDQERSSKYLFHSSPSGCLRRVR